MHFYSQHAVLIALLFQFAAMQLNVILWYPYGACEFGAIISVLYFDSKRSLNTLVYNRTKKLYKLS